MHHPRQPWDQLLDDPRTTLQSLGIFGEDQADIRLHVVAEDLRYPLLCVNGGLHFGIGLNAETGEITGGRECICAARSYDICICDLQE